jgi:hypothetical protein
MVYSFYRQGECFLINPKIPSKFTMQKIIDKDLGQMIMFGGECLIVRSSNRGYYDEKRELEVVPHNSCQRFHLLYQRKYQNSSYYRKIGLLLHHQQGHLYA